MKSEVQSFKYVLINLPERIGTVFLLRKFYTEQMFVLVSMNILRLSKRNFK